MARQRRAPAKETGAHEGGGQRPLRARSGPPPDAEPPQLDDQAAAADDFPPQPEPEPAPAIAGALDQLQEWEVETVEMFVGGLLLILHWTIGREVPDSYRPDDFELRQMAAPLTRAANRSERVRRLAARGDAGAFLFAFGGFVVKETERVADARAQLAASGAAAHPDADFAGVGVAPDDGGPQVRPWRPPAPEPEAPPA